MSHLPLFESFKAESCQPGRCWLCDEPLPSRPANRRGRRRETCGRGACRSLYQSLYGIARRAREVSAHG